MKFGSALKTVLVLALAVGMCPTVAFAEIEKVSANQPGLSDGSLLDIGMDEGDEGDDSSGNQEPADSSTNEADSSLDESSADHETDGSNDQEEGSSDGQEEFTDPDGANGDTDTGGSDSDNGLPTEGDTDVPEDETNSKGDVATVEESTGGDEPLEDSVSVEGSDDKAKEVLSASVRGSVRYRAHVSGTGWQKNVTNGSMAGTTGLARSMEALVVELEGMDGSVECQAHVSKDGWQKPVSSGAVAGTTGRALAMEALKLNLTGKASELYDIYYQVHSSGLGWLGWARNGDAAGSVGMGLGIEAVRIKLVAKGSAFPEYGKAAFQEKMITYQAHVSNLGWRSASSDGSVAGTTGRALGLEALKVSSASTQVGGSVTAQGYVQRVGWQAEVKNGTIGTTGRALALQAVRFTLNGSLAQKYDVYYRVHVSSIGWMGWAKNGAKAGTVGYDLKIEAVQLKLVPKDGQAPGSTKDAYRSRGLTYQAHVSSAGWCAPVVNKATGGSTGKGRALEALCVSLGDQRYSGSIVYQAHVEGVGWQKAVRDGAMAGTTGRSLAIQAMRIKLEGEMAKHYDVYYRMHVSSLGWLDWASNDAVAGTTACSLQAEAIQVALVEKDGKAPGSTRSPSRTLSYSYAASVAGIGWQKAVSKGAVAGTTGKGKAIHQLTMTAQGSSFEGSLQYSVHSAGVGWQGYTKDGTVAGVQGKQVEAVRVRLTGELSQYFDVYYRAHVAGIGWMGWTRNGGNAGTSNLGRRMEAIQVSILPKGSSAPGSTSIPYRDISYTSKVPCIYQNPELPTGCESVALTIVLKSMGFGLSKTEIADFYLPRSSWDYVNAFAGDPRLSGGSYNLALPPAIVTAANRYLSAKGAAARAHNLKGSSFDSLYSYIDQGYPVLVWSTVYMRQPIFYGDSLFGYSWYNNEHCVVMYGYNRSTNKVLVSDPLSGIVWRDASAFKSLYQACGRMAVVIR